MMAVIVNAISKQIFNAHKHRLQNVSYIKTSIDSITFMWKGFWVKIKALCIF